MEEFIEQLYRFIIVYGPEIVLIAATTILLVGIVKLIFKTKLEKVNKTGRKTIYEVLSASFTLIATVGWLLLKQYVFNLTTTPMTLESILKVAATVNIVVKVMYPIYENYGLRELMRTVISVIFDKKKKDEEKEEKENENKQNESKENEDKQNEDKQNEDTPTPTQTPSISFRLTLCLVNNLSISTTSNSLCLCQAS